MEKAPKTYWLNMTTLNDPKKVAEVLAALQAAGVPVAHVGVAGTGTILDAMGKKVQEQGTIGPAIAPLFSDVEAVFALPSGPPILATRNSFLATVKGGLVPAAATGDAARCWLDPLSRGKLMAPLLQGSMLLIVNPSSHQQWIDGTRVLLKHSQSSVLSQEILR